ncbi:hypothetical protein A3A95_01645 [Candidatus Nomurabacteria bacterium RIFCSPLOWO2_01_FULL_39_18]|uniref:Uncharacterized protein n=1 Tax=Candidatus Nomurabacteria bacterium RIFCSPHIGHO2_01_FULL_40_24b TaxID=1801739 RepID=A0A1F6V832_9BACT|nr:MAG: hypothetical protein A2647_01830 [Candidatus Nomurabacteria bacterium RIFCSPHIGHO2_01_FULL_40_24b]OGI88991.1 MAG: hypothetical protein A3A95_01645 [Candidatus Nomurabacteria bacterium RIFCSPLOWO2_01_FULL_39_18]
MSNLINWFTRKKLFVISFLGAVVFFVGNFVDISIPVDVCYQEGFCGDISEALMVYFLIFLPFFIFSLITTKLKDSIFFTWRNFSLWALPISFLFISFFPTFTHGMDFLPIIKGTVSYTLAIVYSIISLILIIYKSLKKE